MEQPEEAIFGIFDEFTATTPGQSNFDEPLSQEEYNELVNSLRKEKTLIKKWLPNGQYRSFLNSLKPHGNA